MNIIIFSIIVTALLIVSLILIQILLDKLNTQRIVNITLNAEVKELEREILTYYSDEIIDLDEQHDEYGI
jgi:hypothetical protein